jgi:Fe-S cluster assembly protein SufD
MAETVFMDALLAPRSALPAAPSDWLKARRASALERAGALSVPSVRDEEWRFTDLSALYKLNLQPAGGGRVTADAIEAHALPEAGALVVLVDGRYDEALSRPLEREGVFVGGLAHALARHGEALEAALGNTARTEEDFFAAVNTAFLQDAAVIYVGPGKSIDAPVHVLQVSTGTHTACHPRVLVVAARSAAATVVEDFVSAGAEACLTNAVAELSVDSNAELRYVKIQREGDSAFHIANTSVALARDARLRSWSIAAGARISRHNLNIYQQGENTDCEMDGLALISGRQLADTHSFIDHAHPNGVSRQLHKTVVGGAAHAVFNGKIYVHQGAQRTNSAQQSRNLLLTPRAHVDSKPQLEIFADDVKCAHGATVGQLEADEMFYLKSRGLSEATARNLLTYAFAAEIVERIPVPSLVDALEKVILEQTQTAGSK